MRGVLKFMLPDNTFSNMMVEKLEDNERAKALAGIFLAHPVVRTSMSAPKSCVNWW